LASCLQSLHVGAALWRRISCALREQSDSDGQALTAFGAARIDHGTAATGFHADQKTVSAGAADLGGLVSAFHFGNPKGLNVIIAKSKPTAMTLSSIPT
jgi:hypothetical protein